MGFLGDLGNQISSQFSLGENTNHTLDNVDLVTGKTVKYGALGDFAKHFDQSSERRYVEEGYLRKDPYNTDSKQFEVLLQEPNATVLLKKKMFSSVGDNFRPDFMDADEKLYYKAMRILFQNKCAQIAALEKLSKIQKITSAMGSVSDQLVPIIISLTDAFNNGLDQGSDLFGALGSSSSAFSGGDPSNFTQVVDRLRRVYAFNTTNYTTSWITDSTNLFESQFGQGTGTIELTNFTNISTNCSTDINSPGNFSMTIADPYETMVITDYDIEKAISDATNMFYNNKTFQFAQESSAQLINDLTIRLNKIRAARAASPISFNIDPDTLLSKRVTAIIDRIGIELPFDYDSSSAASIFSGGAFGQGVTIAPEYLKGGAIAGNDGLDPVNQAFGSILSSAAHTGPDSEVSIFNRLVSTIFSKLSADANSQNAFQLQNKNTNYTRRKLRFNFSGQLIVQAMDTVHIYMNSKSRFDTKLLSGLQNMFSGLGMLQNLNNTLTDFTNATTALFNPSDNVPLQVEKSAYVGPEFPNYLWSLIRNQFVSENEGTHVFAGVVESASDNWSDGKFMIDVRGNDNSTYFDQGKVNFKPGVDVFNGSIFDPLTPFKSDFDSINSSSDSSLPELLDENKCLLSSGSDRSALVKHKLGRYAGQLVSGDNIIQDRSLDPVTGRITRVFYAPDGLAYKWKEGIGVFTQFGSNLSLNDPNRVGNPNISVEPFAGQDVMNVLSLLITGTPYNFATYYKATQNLNGFGTDPQSNQNAAHSFGLSLRNDLVRSNTLWGNFIPFKNMVVDEASYVKAIQKQSTVVQKNQILDGQIQKLKDLNQKAILYGAYNALSDTSKYGDGRFLDIKAEITTLSGQINDTIKQISSEDTSYLQQVGDDTSFDYTDFIDPSKVGKAVSDASLRRLLRRQINYLTRRMSYNVRGNEDKNLFIVDDFYDKDFDIMAYNQALTDGIKLYNNDFASVKDKIRMTANLLNLEVFADTQGHIRVRPPQYNRMPSSVFYKMMYLKQALNIQVFPQFLDDMFNSKLDTLRSRIEILEDQIRLDCAILQHNNDASAVTFILSNNVAQGSGASFAFISDQGTAPNYTDGGLITEIKDLMNAANPDQADNADEQALSVFDSIKGQATSTKDVFTNSQKYSAIVSSLQAQKLSDNGSPVVSTPLFLTNAYVDTLVTRIQTKSGQKIDKRDYLINSATQNHNIDLQLPDGFSIDVFKIIQELSDKIKERQKALKLFYNTIKNAQEFKSLDDADDSTGNQLITPGVYGNSNIPEVFEHMIEDETYDDYGPGSGARFVIKQSQIRSINISANPPPWSAIEVQGTLNTFAPQAVPEGLNSFPDGGNGLVTAFAIDYDMWRNYGFKQGSPINVPFLSDPVSQCGPYASMLLSRNRKNILRGTVTISGNEFMQPGEVVFVEHRGLLFYVASVRHNFNYGSNFTTTLDLTYGHTPGEYIPTVMDMIGKLIYNNKDIGDVVINRQDTSGNEISVGVVQKGVDQNSNDTNMVLNLNDDDSFTNSFSAFNSQVINNILFTVAYQINANNTAGNNVIANIELRTYYDDKNAVDPDIQKFAEGVRQILIGQNIQSPSNKGTTPTPLNPKNVKVVSSTTVNLDDTNDRRSPSQKALDAARNQINHHGTSGGGSVPTDNDSSSTQATESSDDDNKMKKDLRTALFKYIVDCWIKIEPVPPQTTNGS